MKRLKFILLFFISSITLFGQAPKREMRATWLATVWQIDWPASVIVTTGNAAQIAAQKNMMIQILDSLVSANMNAVCFQVRSRCDAMYNSAYEPWSTDLVATRGQNPGYDPLQFVIDEGHKRGIEVHAWLNPYRYETANGQWTGQAGDYRTAHPDWILSYPSGTCILDPGRPEVVKRIKQVVGDIIQKYDVDGILFDDYFYAYGGTSTTLDAATQALYKPADMDLGNWRRANINKMVAAVYDTIQQVKPYVRFGVSPFGIWTTNQSVAIQEGIPLPEGITGGNMYAEIYCDPIAWLKEGTVDYVSPQLYWGTGGSQDYGTLCPWWSKISNQFGKQFYSSQDIAGLGTSSYAPRQSNLLSRNTFDVKGQKINADGMTIIERRISSEKPMRITSGNFSQEQIGTQIGINRSSDENGAPGSIFFSTKQLYQTKGFINYLKKFQFTEKAIVPAIDWKHHATYELVTNIQLNGNALTWNSSYANVRFAVYAIPNDKLNAIGNFSTSTYLLGVSYSTSFTIPAKVSTATNTFAVAVLDRFGNEYPAQIQGQIQGTSTIVSLISPANGEGVIMPFDFSWQTNSSVESYLLEIAEDALFTKMFCSRELNATSYSTTKLDALKQNTTYYWRVKTRKANTQDGISEVRSFIPQRFSVTVPTSGATNVSLTPTISWQNVGNNSSYLLEIATNNQFVQTAMIYSQTVSANTFTIPQKVLSGSTTYYVRVTTPIAGVSTTSAFLSFSTLNVVADIPAFVSPVMNSSVFGADIKLSWSEGVSSGYWIEMSKDPAFPVRSTTVKTIGAYINEYTYTGLTPADYYFRIKASYSGIYTGWSDTLKVTLKSDTGLDNPGIGEMTCKLLQNNNNEVVIVCNATSLVNVSALLYSLAGSELIQICNNKPLAVGENQLSFSTQHLMNGLYLIKVRTNEGELMLKFIK